MSRAPDVRGSEAFALASEYEFEEIIVHCGTNYLNEDSEIEDTFVEIIESLRALKDKFQCRVTYSPILPRVSPQEQEPDNHYSPLSEFSANTLHAIRIINGEVGINNIATILCPEFLMDRYDPYPNKSLLALDGCHLNRRGIVLMEYTLFNHLATNFWVMHY